MLAIALATVSLIVAALGYLRFTAAPLHDDNGWFDAQQNLGAINTIEATPEMKTLILRAELDHFVSPSPLTSRIVRFGHAWRGEPDRLYLGFVGGNPHSLVIYCFARKENKLL